MQLHNKRGEFTVQALTEGYREQRAWLKAGREHRVELVRVDSPKPYRVHVWASTTKDDEPVAPVVSSFEHLLDARRFFKGKSKP